MMTDKRDNAEIALTTLTLSFGFMEETRRTPPPLPPLPQNLFGFPIQSLEANPPMSGNISIITDENAAKRQVFDMNRSPETLPEENDVEIAEDDAAARKKLRLTKAQASLLEETFKNNNNLTPRQKKELAVQLNLQPRQVEVWFQNRRARTKMKQTEVEYEHLRRCCENLKEENRRLQKEVNELRALKLSPQSYLNMSPPTTLIMCPQCSVKELI